MRRAVEAGLEPRGLQDRPQGCADRALAVGAGHLHGREALFGVSASGQGLMQPVKP